MDAIGRVVLNPFWSQLTLGLSSVLFANVEFLEM